MFCPTWILNLRRPQACPQRQICSCHRGLPNRQLSVDNPVYINRITLTHVQPTRSQFTASTCQTYSPIKKTSMLTWMRPAKRKVNDTQKKKHVASHRISTSVSSSQGDIEIPGSEVSEEDTSRVFCNK